MKKKSILSLLLALAMLLALMAGCGTTASSSKAPASEPAPAASESVQEEAPPVEEASAPEDGASAAEEADSVPEELVYEKYEVPLPISDSGEEISMFLLLPPFISAMLESPNDLGVIRALEENTGLHFVITEGSYLDGSTEINLMLASGSYCDIINNISLYASGIDAAVNEDLVIDLYDYILNDMPNFLASLKAYDADVIKQLTTDSGYIAYFPQIHKEPYVDNFTVGVRADLMDELGLDTPATFDEFHDVLTAVKDAYGLQYGMDPGGFDQALLTGFNLKPAASGVEGLRVIGGQVQFTGVADEMYDYIDMIRTWYSEGLIFTDFISYENFMQTNMVAAGTMFGNGSVNAQTIGEADAAGAGAVVESLPYLTPSGSEEIRVYGTGEIIRTPSWSVSTQCSEDTLQLILQLVEYIFSEEGTLVFNYGIEGEAYTLNAAGEPVWTELITGYSGGVTTAAMLYATGTPAEYIPGIYDDAKFNYGYTEAQFASDDIINHSSTGEYDYPIGADNRISSDDALTAAALSTDLSTYVSETVLSWIHGEQVLNPDTWQKYVDTCYSMHLQEILDIYQAGYDQFMSE